MVRRYRNCDGVGGKRCGLILRNDLELEARCLYWENEVAAVKDTRSDIECAIHRCHDDGELSC